MFTMPVPVVNTFTTQRVTQTAGTAIVIMIPPSPGPPGQAPFRYQVGANGAPNWWYPGVGITRVTSVWWLSGATAQTFYINRPFNWTYFPNGLAKNTTAIPNGTGANSTGLFSDPGAYTTSYKYPAQGDLLTGVANATISSTNKYVMYQLANGVWQLDTIASGTFNSSLTLTTGTPNTTGGAILAGTPLFYFATGAGTTLKDPATGVTSWGYTGIASVQNTVQDYINGVVSGLHQGDPLLLFNANAGNDSFMSATGYYGQW